ncbi:MAG: hypothetical protein RLO08_13105 [Parvibaculaceae bacterium]
MTPLETILIQTSISLALAILTAYLTVRFALHRFYREKWWEAKMRAYTDILQALHHMKRDLEISFDAERFGREETDHDKAWEKKGRAAWEEIRKQTDMGEFLFSSESLSILKKLISDTETRADYYVEHLVQYEAAVTECLPAIKASARKDLGLPKLN